MAAVEGSHYVSSNSSDNDPRCSLVAGRTGTRVLGGRPQTRWLQGVDVAKQILKESRVSKSSSHALDLGNVFGRAALYIRTLFDV